MSVTRCTKCNKQVKKQDGSWVHMNGQYRCDPEAKHSTRKEWVATVREKDQ
jgi:hypothetical protein